MSLNTHHSRKLRAGLNVWIVPSDSGQCRHHTLGLSRPYVRHITYRKNTLFDRPSGTEQLHCSKALKFLYRYCSITDLQYRSGWYSGALYTESDESSWHIATESFQVSYNIFLWCTTTHSIQNFRQNFVFHFQLSETSHILNKCNSSEAHWNLLHPPVNLSNPPPNISLRTIFLNSRLHLNR